LLLLLPTHTHTQRERERERERERDVLHCFFSKLSNYPVIIAKKKKVSSGQKVFGPIQPLSVCGRTNLLMGLQRKLPGVSSNWT
jgi:hypothetical protein